MSENLTQQEFAKRIDRDVRTIRKHGDQIRRNQDGTYPWPEAHEDWLQIKLHERESRYGGKKQNLQDEQARKTAIQADIAALELAKLQGELVHIRDLERLVSAPLEAVDSALKSAPSRHAGRLAAAAKVKTPVAMRLLEDVIELVRADLRRTDETTNAPAA